ncbi:MAG: diaminopimelate epimerase [Candidatus Eremiobacteraeota bacterium]|nr:diaminopimelate epimerase [Candidatus Eremiobacteraeota bacterium]
MVLELLHGAENAFAVLDDRDRESPPRPDDEYAHIARDLIGDDRDGLLVVLPSTTATADLRMRMFNPDGSEAEMCGNGTRCIARYIAERGERDDLVIETLAGPVETRVVSRAPYLVETKMGVPQVGAPRELQVQNERFRYVPVSLGNPHVVIFVVDVDAIDLTRLGPAIETHQDFPGGTNVHFARVLDRSTLRVRHWERGAGATRACGTGIVACAAAAVTAGSVFSPVTVHVPGGTLTLTWERRGEAVLSGPVEHTGRRVIEYSL